MQPDPACIELSTHSCQGVCFTVFKRQGHSYATRATDTRCQGTDYQGIPDHRLHSDHELKRGRITCQDCLAAYPAAKALDDARAEARGMRYLLRDARRPLVLPRTAPQDALRVLIIDRLVHTCGRWNIEAGAQWLRAGRGGLGRLPLRLARGYIACAIAGSPQAARRCLAGRRPAAPLPRAPSPAAPGPLPASQDLLG